MWGWFRVEKGGGLRMGNRVGGTEWVMGGKRGSIKDGKKGKGYGWRKEGRFMGGKRGSVMGGKRGWIRVGEKGEGYR